MTLKYALVKGEEIIKFRNVSDDDNLLIGKLSKHGYRVVVESVPPVADDATQSLSDKYVIQDDIVARNWTVREREFDIAKQMKEGILKTTTLDRVGDSLESGSQESDVAAILVKRNALSVLINAATTNEELREIIIEV